MGEHLEKKNSGGVKILQGPEPRGSELSDLPINIVSFLCPLWYVTSLYHTSDVLAAEEKGVVRIPVFPLNDSLPRTSLYKDSPFSEWREIRSRCVFRQHLLVEPLDLALVTEQQSPDSISL